MKTTGCPLLLLTAALVVGGCSPPPPPETTGPPPLFNAVDPSLQCEAGYIGWDFSTGGNTEALRRNTVGNTIAITEASFGGGCTAGLADSFRSACDGYESCTLSVPGCTNADVTLQYQCGTEPSTYQARIEQGAEGEQITLICGSPITIVHAVYAPDADEPADITNALAAVCTGKRRCANGASGFELNNHLDPAPNVAKKVLVSYVCDAEYREQQVLVDDFNLDFYCRDTGAPPAHDSEFLSIQTVVPRSTTTRRCSGAWCTEEHYAYYEDAYASRAARLFDRVAAACDLQRDCQVELDLPSTTDPAYADIEPAPDEVDMLGIPLGPADLGYAYQDYLVGYTCGSDPELNWKVIPRRSPYTPNTNAELELQCGERLAITDVYVGQSEYSAERRAELLGRLQGNCDGKRVCYSPTPQGRSVERYYDANGNKQVRNYQNLSGYIDVEYTCGDIDFARRYIARVDFSAYGSNHIECDARRDDLFQRGIRIDSVSPSSRTQEITKLCFGRDHCDLPRTSDLTVSYRCGEGAELLSAQATNGSVAARIECRPAASFRKQFFLDSNGNEVDYALGRCEYFVYEDLWSSPGGGFSPSTTPQDYDCRSRYPSCPFPLTHDADGDGSYETTNFCDVDTVYWRFQCGPDPTNLQTFALERGENWDDSRYPVYPRYMDDVSCEPPVTPYVKKKCVPKVCLGQTRRGEELECVTDSTLVPVFHFLSPVVKQYLANPDGSHSRWGGDLAIEDDVTTLRSGHPYQLFPLVTYQTPGGVNQPLPEGTEITTWAYDVFEPVDEADTSPDVPGFRCLVSSTSVEGAYTWNVGYWGMFAGGTPMTIPPTCFGHDKEKANDPSTSWYDAAKRADLSESEFKQRYRLKESKLVSSLDPAGHNTVRWFGAQTSVPPNPIGFFYDPTRDWVDVMGFYGQRADFQNAVTASFLSSTEIEIGALQQRVTANRFEIDVNDPTLKPSIAVDFSWYLRGNSVKNPFSPDSEDVNAPRYSLKNDRLRAVVEIAYKTDDGTEWAPISAARFSETQPLQNHNAFFQTERLELAVSDLMRKRMLTVRGTSALLGESPDGWRTTFKDEDTVFELRTCLVSDDFAFALGADDAATPSQSANDYSLKLAKRCTAPTQLVLHRELYVTPTTPASSGSADTEAASMGGSGDSDVNSNEDNGSQSNCSTLCTVDADCGGNTCSNGTCDVSADEQRCTTRNRSGAGSGVGAQGISLYSNRSDSVTTTESGEKRSVTSNVTELLGFAVMNIVEDVETSISDGLENYEFTFDIAFKLPRILQAKDAPKPKPKIGIKLDPVEITANATRFYGISFVVFAQLAFTIGPFPLTVRFEWVTALVPHLTLKLKGNHARDGASGSTYPCFDNASGTGAKCYRAEAGPKTFEDAKLTCLQKGGRLATAHTQAQAAALSEATQSNASEPHWVGAVPQYLYQYAPCADVGTAGAAPIPSGLSCAERSETRYVWLTPDEASSRIDFAKQSGLSTTFYDLRLPSPLTMDAASSYVTQGPAGVYYQPSSNELGHRPFGDGLRYVCEYEPASAVVSNAQDISIALEVMSALRLEVCTPSNEFGICLEGKVKFFTASIRFGVNVSRTDIFVNPPGATEGGHTALYSTLNGTTLYGKVEASAIAADIAVILRAIFWDTRILIKKFPPVWKTDRTLFEVPNNSYELHLESAP